MKGEDILVLSPPVCDQNCAINYDKRGNPRWTFESRLIEYLNVLAPKTEEWGVGYVDLHTPMLELTRELQKENPRNILTTDCIHPNATGQVLIAYCVLQEAEEECLSEICILADGTVRAVVDQMAALSRKRHQKTVKYRKIWEMLQWTPGRSNNSVDDVYYQKKQAEKTEEVSWSIIGIPMKGRSGSSVR